MYKNILSILALLLVTAIPALSLTVMSVDFGAEFMKVAVVAPGVPMEIALNKESKRKTPVAIAFRDGERTFGDDAITAGMRSPSSLFTNLLHLLGKEVSHPIVQNYIKVHPQHNIVEDPERKTVVFKLSDTESYSIEELIAQLLSHARDQASAYTNQKVKDLVITVPAFFNQAERRALLDAADIAGLKVLSLISNNAAVALNYGMFRRKEINGTAQHLMFYDMGSSQTTATIVTYQTVKTKERGYSETNPQVTVIGVGFDRTLGGYEMQLRLRDFLAQKFNDMKKTKTDVFKNPRAMSKLNKEAGKLKQVLSANSDFVSQVENVMEDIDLRVQVTRAEFENLIKDLVERSTQPINDALISAQLDKSAIDQLVLVGGSTRVPIIQEKIQELWGRELARNINADEAGALGAVYRAADMGQGFKVKTFLVKESNLYPIEVEFDRAVEQSNGESSSKVVKRSLFAVGNIYPQKKVMTFNKHVSDFLFRVNYGDLSEHMPASKVREQFAGDKKLLTANVNEVTKNYNKHVVEDKEDFKGIKAHFYLDGSGLLQLNDVELVVEKNVTVEEEQEESTFQKIGSTLTKLFGGEEGNGTEAENATKTDDGKDTADKTDSVKDKKPKNTTSKLVTEKIVLKTVQLISDIPLLGEKQHNASFEKLSLINAHEAERERRAAGRNHLETRILDIKDKMSQDEYIKASVEGDQKTLGELCSTLEDWLYEDGFDAESKVYTEKVASLDKVFAPIDRRVEEHRQRPEAIKALTNMMNISSVFIQRARDAPEGENYFTSVELQKMDDLIVSTQSWLEKAEEEQSSLSASEEPTLSLTSIAEKIGDMDREMKYMVNKAKMAKAKADREAAEAKIKAEKEAKEEAAKKKKEKEAKEKEDEDNEDKDDELEEEDSRHEPVMPEEPSDEEAMEDAINPDRVKDDEEPHSEL